MSNNVDLTIIAIAVGVLAIVAIVILLMLVRVLVRLLAIEQSVTQELKVLSGDVRDMVQNVRQTSERVTDAVGTVTRSATWLGRLFSVLVTTSKGRNRERLPKVSDPVPDPTWWLTGLKWGWSLLANHRKKKRKRTPEGSHSA